MKDIKTILMEEELPSGFHGRDQEDPAIIMSVRIKSSQMHKLEALHAKYRVSKGAIIRHALNRYLREQNEA